ncbi:MAG: hypothetical protein IKD69_14000 [Solobacterium sp.]|nr:hypothetical protein [Solobacterium sp.]
MDALRNHGIPFEEDIYGYSFHGSPVLIILLKDDAAQAITEKTRGRGIYDLSSAFPADAPLPESIYLKSEESYYLTRFSGIDKMEDRLVIHIFECRPLYFAAGELLQRTLLKTDGTGWLFR